ncbi:hypothetical protein Ppa06_57600 [Planomonospora parontospora subsp. parontospora]|uniref:Uncharacterized protein n=2 Tax=Planomonospora parontospora TaxID=58119 RepID=A0AA37BMK4_9ACTN|nr:hypothetical protein [Planomonospora parontospora]GGK90733.1 hypothetical protein GCM10010126_57710 [Planomonospora parontospora]GII11962.1 hypothetical protein Ppa06_57600 [Planomonospora parontospora subsp. parontospora]
MSPVRRDTPSPPPEAVLITRLRRREGSISKEMAIREANRRAAAISPENAFSEGTWRNIESGRTEASDKQLALMALVVGATPEQLEEAGRPAAAQLLRAEAERRVAADPVLAELDDLTPERVVMDLLQKVQDIRRSAEWTEGDKEQMIRKLLARVMATVRSEE